MCPVAPKVGLALAPVGAVYFLAFYALAMSRDPGYTFFENYLSDLGVGPGAWAFNTGVIGAGLLLLAFAVLGLRGVVGADVLSQAGAALFGLSGVFLVNIGIFTEDAGDTHTFFSFAFFITALVSFGVLAASMRRGRPLGTLAFVATAVTFVAGALLLPFGANPATETVAVLLIVSWGLVVPMALLVRWPGTAVSGSGGHE